MVKSKIHCVDGSKLTGSTYGSYMSIIKTVEDVNRFHGIVCTKNIYKYRGLVIKSIIFSQKWLSMKGTTLSKVIMRQTVYNICSF